LFEKEKENHFVLLDGPPPPFLGCPRSRPRPSLAPHPRPTAAEASCLVAAGVRLRPAPGAPVAPAAAPRSPKHAAPRSASPLVPFRPAAAAQRSRSPAAHRSREHRRAIPAAELRFSALSLRLGLCSRSLQLVVPPVYPIGKVRRPNRPDSSTPPRPSSLELAPSRYDPLRLLISPLL
jgi:hypothetical protein